jgi:hypothetical protein
MQLRIAICLFALLERAGEGEGALMPQDDRAGVLVKPDREAAVWVGQNGPFTQVGGPTIPSGRRV